ncbi:MAG TPA: response regulator [Tepidisphaeraceae bacterium]|nr:response regulator [Tepidisphaeraceae bacterium]
MRPDPFDVLIVDDDPEIARLLRMVLESRRYPCRVAYGGAQALSRFAARPARLVITDLHMEAGDGAALIHNIRRWSNVPIIIVSGFSRQYAESVRRMPDVRMIAKPIEINALMRQVRACRFSQAGPAN